MLEKLLAKIEENKDQMIDIRRYLHENPELSFEEVNTSKYIADFYKDKDVDVQTNVGNHGVKVTIDSGKPGKTLAIRADFDALPIEEATGLPFASKNPGVMHACGHDAHTAYMLILADALIELKDEFEGKIVIIHQDAEEVPPGGAIGMIKDGVLAGVDNTFGIHVMSNKPYGEIHYVPGEAQNGRAKFVLKVQSVGGHGSSPHEANDAIVAASYFVTAIQTVVSRRLSPFDTGVVTIGSFDGKGSFNAIKDSVVLEGDVRGMSEEVRKKIEVEVKRIVKGLEVMYNVTCELDYANDYPVLYNNPELTEHIGAVLSEANLEDVTEVVKSGPMSPSEDFAYYAKEVPSSFFYVGAAPVDKEAFPHHHPKFDIEEGSMMIAARAMATVVADYFSNDQSENK